MCTCLYPPVKHILEVSEGSNKNHNWNKDKRSVKVHIFIHNENERHDISTWHGRLIPVKTFKRKRRCIIWPVHRKVFRQDLHSSTVTPTEPFIWSHKQLKVSCKIKIHDKCDGNGCQKHRCGHKRWAKPDEPQDYNVHTREPVFTQV